MADYSSLPSTTGAQPQLQGQAQTPAYQYTEKKSGPSGVAIAALIIGMIALLLIVVGALWWWYQMGKSNGNPYWAVFSGTSTGATDTWSPDGNDMYQVKNPTSFTLTVNTSSVSLNGRMFMVDNTANANTHNVTVAGGSGVTISDNTGKGLKVVGGTSAQFIWYTSTTITRLT